MSRALDLFLTAVIVWIALGFVLCTFVGLLLRFNARLGALVDVLLGGDRHLQDDRQEFFAEVRAIGGGRRHLRIVEAIGDDVDRDVFPKDAA